MQPICRSTLLSFLIPATGGAAGSFLRFQDVPKLNGCKITAFETFTAGEMALDPNRQAVLPAADAVNVSLTMADGADQRIQSMPFTKCVAQLNAGVYPEVVPFAADWQKCQFEFNAAVTASTSCVIQVYYVRPEDAPELFPEFYDQMPNGLWVRKQGTT